MNAETKAIVAVQLEVLGDFEKQVLTQLHGLDGSAPKTIKEIAKSTGLPQNRVRTYALNAKTKIEHVAKGPEYYLYARLGIFTDSYQHSVATAREHIRRAATLNKDDEVVSELIKAMTLLTNHLKP